MRDVRADNTPTWSKPQPDGGWMMQGIKKKLTYGDKVNMQI